MFSRNPLKKLDFRGKKFVRLFFFFDFLASPSSEYRSASSQCISLHQHAVEGNQFFSIWDISHKGAANGNRIRIEKT